MKKPSSMIKMVVVVIAVMTLVLTLCQTAFATAEETLDVLAKNVAFQDPIKLVFAVDTTDSNVELLVWKEAPTEYTLQGEPAPEIFKPQETTTVKGKSCKIFYVSGLNAKEMTKDIYVCACVRNGDTITYGNVVKYSILQYARNTIAKASTKESLKVLLQNMLAYGAAAQVNFDYNTDRLANANYYDISVVGGVLPDRTQQGLYLEGETVTMTAPATSGDKVFYYWKNSANERVGYEVEYTTTVGEDDETYTAVYATVAEICAESGHDFVLVQTAEHLATAATCTTPATYYKVCSLCGTHSDDTFPVGEALGHKFTRELATEAFLKSEATCSASAVYYKSCAVCGEAGEGTFTVGNPIAHGFTATLAEEEYLVSAATCTEAAVYYKSCVYCGLASDTLTFEGGTALGHDFTEWDGTPATCLTDGVKERHCQRENCEETESQVIPATGHSWPDWDITPATCLNDGLKRRICENCNEVEATLLPATGHSYSESWTADYFNHWHMPTCSDGAARKDVTAHTFVDGVCTVCNYVKPADTVGLAYALNDDKASYRVKGIGTATPDANGYIVIPSMYNGKPVTMIDNRGNEVFMEIDGLINVVIPDTVKVVGEGAFIDCIALQNVMVGSDDIEFQMGSLFLSCHNSLTFKGSCNLKLAGDAFVDSNLKWLELPHGTKSLGKYSLAGSFIETLIIPSTVTSIDDNTFDYIILKNVTIPIEFQGKLARRSTVLENVVFTQGYAVGPDVAIDNLAFYGFTELQSVTFPTSLKSIGQSAFQGCTKLQGVVIPSSVTSVGQSAFEGSGLVSVTINEHPTLYSRAFGNCDKLTSVTIQDDNFDTINTTNAFRDSTHIVYLSSSASGIPGIPKDSLKTAVVTGGLTLPESAFESAKKLESVTLPAGMTTIGSYAFYGTERLTSIELPSSVSKIGSHAFEHSVFTSISFPSAVMNIGESAFRNCDGLESITLGNPSLIIGNYAFGECDNLKTFTCTQASAISNYAFYKTSIETATLTAYDCAAVNNIALKTVVITSGTTIPNNAFNNCLNLESVTLPDTITSIGNVAFKDCISLESITLPESLKTIGYNAFENCRALESITIPNAVTSIGTNAFYNCIALESVTIPSSVKMISQYTFQNCTALTSVTIPSSVTTIGINAFNNCNPSMTIYYDGTLSQWAAISKTYYVGASDHYTVICTNGTLTT